MPDQCGRRKLALGENTTWRTNGNQAPEPGGNFS
jgi:hypothetical protein